MEKPSLRGFFHRISKGHWQFLAIGGLVSALVLVFPPGKSSIYPPCILKTFSGYECPGCGGLRGLHELLTGNLANSIALNPLVVIAAAYLVAFSFPSIRVRLAILENKRAFNWGLIIFLIGFTLARNVKGVVHV